MFIAPAFAQTSTGFGFGDSPLTAMLPFVLIFVIMYFLMIRPQQKRRREAMQMQSTLAPGDQIVTIGGLHATVVSVDDDVVTLELSPGVTARYARPAIARVLKRDTVAAEEPVEAAPVADDPIQSPIVETRKND